MINSIEYVSEILKKALFENKLTNFKKSIDLLIIMKYNEIHKLYSL